MPTVNDCLNEISKRKLSIKIDRIISDDTDLPTYNRLEMIYHIGSLPDFKDASRRQAIIGFGNKEKGNDIEFELDLIIDFFLSIREEMKLESMES